MRTCGLNLSIASDLVGVVPAAAGRRYSLHSLRKTQVGFSNVTFLSRVLQFGNGADKKSFYRVIHASAKNGAAHYRGYAFLGRGYGFCLVEVIRRGWEY